MSTHIITRILTLIQGPGMYLGCLESARGSAPCPFTSSQMPKGAAPSLLPRELTGAQWRPASFHHITSDGEWKEIELEGCINV
jgi:hypothetical protein